MSLLLKCHFFVTLILTQFERKRMEFGPRLCWSQYKSGQCAEIGTGRPHVGFRGFLRSRAVLLRLEEDKGDCS